MAHDESRLEFTLDGVAVTVEPGLAGGSGLSLLDVLRGQLGVTSAKDGCSPQGQCGCCTVLVDGQARVACVTPARRVAGRAVTTLDGLDPDRRRIWADAFYRAGASQCGFCTPGIIVRLDALAASRRAGDSLAGGASRAGDSLAGGASRAMAGQALLAHLCRCTGWQTILEAWDDATSALPPVGSPVPASVSDAAAPGTELAGLPRPLQVGARRAMLEGGVGQRVGPEVALGQGGFAADTAPPDALIALSDGAGWVVGETLAEARAVLRKVQGRRTTVAHSWPLELPEGEWAARLRTTWVEPAYLEPDASWCLPGGEPASPVANGGAFGAKGASPASAAARQLADRHGRAVLVLATREDVTRWGPKRPPVAGGARPDGSGHLRVVATPGVATAIAAVAPGLLVEELSVVGPPTSAAIRAAGWAEALVLVAAATGAGADERRALRSPSGAEAWAEVAGGAIRVGVRCGEALDAVVLRSYCIGAAHMAWSWVTSEALTVGPDGQPVDLTIRSFGVVRAIDMPPVEVTIDHSDTSPAVNGSDAVFAAVAAATWRAAGLVPDWPTSASFRPPPARPALTLDPPAVG